MFNRKNISSLSDKELVDQYQKSKKVKYFGNIFNRYSHLVYGACLKYLKNVEDAEDAMMQIFEKAMKDMLTTQINYPKSWLYCVAKNHCLMKLRSKKIGESSNEYLDNLIEEENGIDEKILQEVHLQDIEKGLEKLKPNQKKALVLFYLEDKSYSEISAETSWDIKKVKSELQNGKRNLKLILTK